MLSALIFVFCLSVTLQIGVPVAFSAAPVLFFSDLTWGPKTGWEGSSSKGAAVTIWGNNFGSPISTSYITVGGVNILSTDTSGCAEWAVTGTSNHVARGLQRTTFWLNSNMLSGNVTISVTVNGVKSNTLPFNITTGTIYFVSVTDGDNSYNGLYSTRTGHGGSDGPFKDLWKFNPCGANDPNHTPGSCNPSRDGQYIVYVRKGIYTTADPAGDPAESFITMRGNYGGTNKQKALIGYPAEVAEIDCTNNILMWFPVDYQFSGYGTYNYFTWAKLYLNGHTSGGIGAGAFGTNTRFIALHFKDFRGACQCGVIETSNAPYVYFYGNIFENCGDDSMKHNIYIKTYGDRVYTNESPSQYNYIGWNEFNAPYASDEHGGTIFLSVCQAGGSCGTPNGHYTNHIYIHDNYFHDGTQSDFVYADDSEQVDYVWVWNNIFTGGSGNSAIFLTFGNLNHWYIYNNTFYNTGDSDGVVGIVNDSSKSDVRFANNIIFANNSPSQGFIYTDNFTSGISSISSTHDLFYSPTGVAPPALGGGVTNYVTSDPKFVDPVNRIFSLQPGSPALGTGTSSLIRDASSDIPIATRDYNGLLRATPYDIGAVQYTVGTPDYTIPAAPKSLRIIP